MAWWFFRGLRRGVITTRYPATPPDPWTATLPTPPAFRPEALTAETVAGLIDVCPSRALRREAADLVLDVGACTACGLCLAAYPDAAMPSGQIELAATDRAQLVKRIPIQGGTR
ncbi:MAG: hypothetical protein ACRDN9_06540 [Streptosporangiaceae bacterium]